MLLNDDVAQDILDHCDRTRSKEARVALEKLVWKPLQKDGLTLSNHCILAPTRDILSAQESRKSLLNDRTWKCMICKKVFKNEHYLDKHLARKHAEVRDNGTSVCFADLCGSTIPCVPLSRYPLPRFSSASLALSDKGQAVQFPETKEYCDEKIFRRRRIVACAETVKECLQEANGRVAASIRRKHTERLRWDICEKAAIVDCVQRENVWERLGSPSEVLKVRSHNSQWFPIVCAIVAVVSTLLMVMAGISERGSLNPARVSHRKPRKHE
ncbi:hypothetical protein FGB62_59g113 [Gracilaria domingensis]|nr:hypothetical protein FGB62_59g113 [Gracilaria domingensis]